MKRKRIPWWLKILLGLTVAVIGLLTLAFNPGFQTALVRHFAEPQFARFSLEQLKADLGKIELRELDLSTDNALAVRIESLEGTYLLQPALAGTGLQIQHLRGRGIIIDSRNLSEDPDQQKRPMPWPEDPVVLQLPLPLTLGQLDLEGHWLGPDDQEARFQITSEGLQPGQTGQVAVMLRLQAPSMAVVEMEARIDVTQSASGVIETVQLTSPLRLSTQDGRPPLTLNAELTLSMSNPELPTLQLSLGDGIQELNIHATGDLGNQDIATNLEFNLNEDWLTYAMPELLGIELQFQGNLHWQSTAPLAPQGEAALRLESLPLSLLEAWVPGFTFGETELSGQLTFQTVDTRLSVDTPAANPLQLERLSIYQDGTPLVENLNLLLQPQGQFGPSSFTLKVPGQLNSERAQELINLELTAAGLPNELLQTTGSLRLSTDLPRLFKLPVLARQLEALHSGTLECELQLAANPDDAGWLLQTTATLRDLRRTLREPPVFLAAMQSEVILSLFTSKIVTQSSLQLEAAQGISKLEMAGGWDSLSRTYDIQLQSERLHLDDFQDLAAIFKKREPAAAPSRPQPKSPRKTDAPAWMDWNGQAGIQIDLLTRGNTRLTDINAQLTSENRVWKLEPATIRYLGTPFGATALLAHRSNASEPYLMEALAQTHNFEAASLLSELSTGQPMLTGPYQLEARLHAEAPSLSTLAHKAQGSIDLQGGPGRLRLYDDEGLASLGISLVGGVLSTGNGRINRLLELLSNLRYDTVTLHISRAEDLDVNLTEMLLQAPGLRIRSEGKVNYSEALGLLDQALELNVAVDTQGELSELFRSLDLQTDARAASGYTAGPRLRFGGSLNQLDTSELQQLTRSVITSQVRGLGGLLSGESSSSDNRPASLFGIPLPGNRPPPQEDPRETEPAEEQRPQSRPRPEDVIPSIFGELLNEALK